MGSILRGLHIWVNGEGNLIPIFYWTKKPWKHNDSSFHDVFKYTLNLTLISEHVKIYKFCQQVNGIFLYVRRHIELYLVNLHLWLKSFFWYHVLKINNIDNNNLSLTNLHLLQLIDLQPVSIKVYLFNRLFWDCIYTHKIFTTPCEYSQ